MRGERKLPTDDSNEGRNIIQIWEWLKTAGSSRVNLNLHIWYNKLGKVCVCLCVCVCTCMCVLIYTCVGLCVYVCVLEGNKHNKNQCTQGDNRNLTFTYTWWALRKGKRRTGWIKVQYMSIFFFFFCFLNKWIINATHCLSFCSRPSRVLLASLVSLIQVRGRREGGSTVQSSQLLPPLLFLFQSYIYVYLYFFFWGH